jgi:hypothetical protein
MSAPTTAEKLLVAPPGDASSAFFGEARSDAPLGTLLFRAGLVPDDELRDALEFAVENNRRLGEILLERRLVTEPDLARILATQKGLSFVELGEVRPDPAAVALIPEQSAREWGALVIDVEDGRPVVAVSDPANRYLFGRITETLGRKPRFVVAVPSELAPAIATAYERLAAAGIASPSGPPVAADAPAVAVTTQVVVLLTNGERVPVSRPASRVEALEEAQSLIRSLDERTPGAWPLADGRFLRPEAIVSVDVVDVAA